MPNDLLTNRESLLDPAYVEFVQGDFTSELGSRVGSKAGLNQKQQDILENAIVLFLYCFLNKTELENFITTECKVSPEVANELVTVIMMALPDDLKISQDATYLYLSGQVPDTPDTPSAPPTPPAPPAPASAPVAPTPPAPSAVPPPPSAPTPPPAPPAPPAPKPQPVAPPQPETTHATTSQDDLLNNRIKLGDI